jgi:uncharacterized protein (DUF4415 family)
MTEKGLVVRELDPNAPPRPFTPEEQAQLAALREAQERDDPVDYSDIPPLDEAFWRAAKPNPFFRPAKEQVTVRLDADVLAWLRADGRGYQTRLNDVLREAMLREAPPSSAPAPATPPGGA